MKQQAVYSVTVTVYTRGAYPATVQLHMAFGRNLCSRAHDGHAFI